MFICLVVNLRVTNVTTNYNVACNSIGRNTKEKVLKQTTQIGYYMTLADLAMIQWLANTP